MYSSETFGRLFWVDDNYNFKSCPQYDNGTGDFDNEDYVNSDITLAASNAYIVDTSSARALTLPASGTLGDEIKIIDGTGQAASNNITINRNSHKIQGLTDNLVINVNRAAQGLVYFNAAQGWILTEN